ncbi:MAG: glycosyltransferase [Sphaerochaetaceae bacterium]|nr:glycosyltransferase [Sphaerochaetaceae bacterium]
MVESNDKKIAFFLGSLARGGAERVISNLSQDYARNGWITEICLLLSYKIQYPLDESTDVIDFSGSTTSRTLRIPYWLKAIRQFVKVEKPDYIIAFTARINLLVILACIGLDARIIISERNDPRFDGRGRLVDFLTKLLYPKAQCLVFQTKKAQEYFSERIKNKSCIIPNPIYVSCLASPVKKKKIVTIGRLTQQKNQKMLIAAFAKILPAYKDYQLEIFGDGELRNELIAYSKELGIQNSVMFNGVVQNIHERISDAEIFVLSSDYEGLSNALLEAMMMGLACISTRCAGADEYITDGENGLLIPIKDEEALIMALKKLLDNTDFRNQIEKNAANSVSHLGVNNIYKHWYEITC